MLIKPTTKQARARVEKSVCRPLANIQYNFLDMRKTKKTVRTSYPKIRQDKYTKKAELNPLSYV